MALDADDSGSINGGEFGHFMRLADMERAKGPPPKTWKQKLMEDQQERGLTPAPTPISLGEA